MASSPEQKQLAWQKVRSAIGSRLEWLQQHPLRGSLLAMATGLGSLYVAPLCLDLTQKSDIYAGFAASKPIDKLLAFLTWLVTGIVPIPVLVILALGPVAWFGIKWWLANQRDRLEGEKAPRIEPEIEGLKRCVGQERPKEIPAVERDILGSLPHHRSVISFLFKFKNCTWNDLCSELSLSQSESQRVLKDLEIDHHLIDRIGRTLKEQTIYALNENGTKYATDRKMTPGNQSRDKIRASEAEKELARLKQAHAETVKELTEAKKDRAEFKAKVSQLNAQLDSALNHMKSAAVPVSGSSPTITDTGHG